MFQIISHDFTNEDPLAWEIKQTGVEMFCK